MLLMTICWLHGNDLAVVPSTRRRLLWAGVPWLLLLLLRG